MQLILNADSTLNIETKMNEETFEKCVTTVLPAVTNGDLPNGDILKENDIISFKIKDDNLGIKTEIGQNKADGDINQELNNLCSNNVDIKISHKNEEYTGTSSEPNETHSDTNDKLIERPTDLFPGDDPQIKSPICNESDINDLRQVNSENVCLGITAKQKQIDDIEEKTTDDNSASNNIDASESAPVEDGVPSSTNPVGFADIEKENDIKCSNSTIDVEKSEDFTHEICPAEPRNNLAEVEMNDNSVSNNAVEACETIIPEKQSTEESITNKTILNDNDITTNSIANASDCVAVANDHTDTTIIVKETEIQAINNSNNTSMDVTPYKEIEQENNVSVGMETENNDIIENKITLDEKDKIASMKINDHEIMISEVESTGDGTDGENKLEDVDVAKCNKENDLKVNEEIVSEQLTYKNDDHMDVSENKLEDVEVAKCIKENDLKVNEEIVSEQLTYKNDDHMDVSENKLEDVVIAKCNKENDLKVNEEIVSEQLTYKNDDHIDVSEKKSSEEEHSVEIAEEKETEDANLVNLDDKKEREISSSPCDIKEIEHVNINSEDPAKTALIDTIEPVTEKEEETMDVTPDSSDDIIFNLDDDDKDAVEVKGDESREIIVDDDKLLNCHADNEATVNSNKVVIPDPKPSGEVIDLDDTSPNHIDSKASSMETKEQSQITEVSKSPVLKLSNTLDILSDEEDDSRDTNMNNKCINIEDDDDVMLIDEETSGTERDAEPVEETKTETQVESKPESAAENMEVSAEIESNEPVPEPLPESVSDKEALVPEKEVVGVGLTSAPEISDKVEENKTAIEINKPLMHEKFLNTCKKSLADMTREELEEFCIVKIVESILDRSNLSEIKNKLKTMSQTIEEYKKKAMMLTKQNRDLQVVLKSIQEDQKKGTESIVPLKITRSVGMQVLMSDKPVQRRKAPNPPAPIAPANRPVRNPVPQSPRPQKPAAPQIPVPRLVPANNPNLKSPNTPQANTGKIPSPVPNGVRNPSPVQKGEKRTHNRIQSVTVDLTDDEPPSKVASRGQPAPVPPVRLVPSQNLLAPPRPTAINSPRKVYIPISGPQGQNVRPGQTIMLKTVATSPGGPRQRCPPPHMVRVPQTMRMTRPQGMRHPAPLPDCMKQYQPPNWKALPPAPDLKLAKVENGIVISWKIEGYQEDSYEEIASYQLYAYQETSSPPSTALWKKIGDVKALPLPMACTLTQFMAGYKYYFAVRAVDIRSRLGPFSLPGSILLLNKI